MANANAGNGLIKYAANVINVVASAAFALGDLIIVGPWFGVCLNSAAQNESLSVDIEEGKELDLVSTVSGVAAAVGDMVYYNPTTGAFAAAYEAGYAGIGYTTVIKDSNNCFRIEKFRYWKIPPTLADISDIADLAFADLADVDVAGVTDNDTLKYVASTGKWTDVAV